MNLTELNKTLQQLEALSCSDIFPQQVLKQANVLHFSSKEQIVLSKDPYDALYFILEGRTFVTSYSIHGDKAIIDTLEASEFFGDIELYSQAIFSLHHVIAGPNTVVLKIPKKIVEESLNQHVPFLNLMCQKLTQKLMNTSFNYSKTLLLLAKNKLARYIIEQAELFTKEDIPFSVKKVAEILGISDRHLRRLLHQFEENEMIIKYRSHVTILSLDELIALANE